MKMRIINACIINLLYALNYSYMYLSRKYVKSVFPKIEI